MDAETKLYLKRLAEFDRYWPRGRRSPSIVYWSNKRYANWLREGLAQSDLPYTDNSALWRNH